MSKLIDLTGKRFGKLTVIEKAGHHIRKSGRKDLMWKCLCDCGNIKSVTTANLKNGCTNSCGCIQRANRYKPHRESVFFDSEDCCNVVLYSGEVVTFDKEYKSEICKHNWHLSGGYSYNGQGV